MYLINQVAKIANVSVRTLHYYDEIELLVPKVMEENLYRLYSDIDLKKLQDILFLKELGFKLSDIKQILSGSKYVRLEALKSHKKVMDMKIEHLQDIMKTLDLAIEEEKGGNTMKDQDRFKAFDMSDIEKHNKQYAAETKEKYGDTSAYKESRKKTKDYTAEDWARINTEAESIYKAFYELKGTPVDDPAVQEQVTNWQNHITRYFYKCTDQILSGLGDMYIADQRFTENIDKYGTGIAQMMHDAIKVYR